MLGLSEMLGFDLEDEIMKKVSKNEKRVYKNIDGTNIRVSDWEEYYIFFFLRLFNKKKIANIHGIPSIFLCDTNINVQNVVKYLCYAFFD